MLISMPKTQLNAVEFKNGELVFKKHNMENEKQRVALNKFNNALQEDIIRMEDLISDRK